MLVWQAGRILYSFDESGGDAATGHAEQSLDTAAAPKSISSRAAGSGTDEIEPAPLAVRERPNSFSILRSRPW